MHVHHVVSIYKSLISLLAAILLLLLHIPHLFFFHWRSVID